MSKINVLIVEDDIVTAMDVEHELIQAGYNVSVAVSESQAFRIAEKCRPQLAVVDINLNPGDGRVVAKALNRNYDTAVLFATAQCEDVEDLKGAGAMACLAKPYEPEAVVTALRQVRRMSEGRDARLQAGVISLKAW